MSATVIAFCSALLDEHFGENVRKVGVYLMRQVSSCPLFLIARSTSIPVAQVKQALCILIQHNLCTFKQEEKGFVEYSVKYDAVLHILYYQHYSHSVNIMFKKPAGLLLEGILNQGKLTATEAIQNLLEREQDTEDQTNYSAETIWAVFKLLVENRFLIRCPYPHAVDARLKIPTLSISPDEMFTVPQVKLHLLRPDSSEPGAKRPKLENPDEGVYWSVNFPRFFSCFRDEAILTACSGMFGEESAEILKIILSFTDSQTNILSPTSQPVSYYDILTKFSAATSLACQDLDCYLASLCGGEGSFVSKADDRGNGMYVVNIKKILQRLVEDTVASVMQERFGSNCARIFRLLLEKKILEPKQIEELAMLQPKDTKEYIYKMFSENYILSHDIPKGSDFSHGQIYYLLKIDLKLVARMELERCYKALLNLMLCSRAQIQENRRLLDKKQRVDAIVAILRQNGEDEESIEEEVQQLISDQETAVINKVNAVNKKLVSREHEIGEMVSLLTIWIEYSKLK